MTMTPPASARPGLLFRLLKVGAAATASAVALGLALSVSGAPRTEWVLTSGLLALVALPVLRLMTVLGSLARAREWRFVLIGAVVLMLLALTLLWRSD